MMSGDGGESKNRKKNPAKPKFNKKESCVAKEEERKVFKVGKGTLRYGDYGLRLEGLLTMEHWASTQRVARKYEVKIADYSLRTTNKARIKLQEKLASLFIHVYILHPECLLEKFEMPMFTLW